MIKDVIVCFGIQGILAAMLFLASVLVVLNYIRSFLRHRHLLKAFFLALLSFILAWFASIRISSIEIDRSLELKEAVSKQLMLRGEDDKDGFKIASKMHFVEDSAEDKLDLAGIKSADKQSIYQRTMAEAEEKYEYRKRGKQKRSASLSTNDVSAEALSSIVSSSGESYKSAEGTILMPRHIVELVDKLDITLRTTILIFIFLLGSFLIYEYLSKFNLLLDYIAPLPISGKWLDSIFQKKTNIALITEDSNVLRKLLEDFVKKGETFLSFGLPDIPLSEKLPKISVNENLYKKNSKISILAYLQDWFCKHNFVPVYEFSPQSKPFSAEFIFENAWFKRSCSVLKDTLASEYLSTFFCFLKSRFLTGARAKSTINILVYKDLIQPYHEKMEELSLLVKDTNCRLICVIPSLQLDQIDNCLARFEEIIDPNIITTRKAPPTLFEMLSIKMKLILQALSPFFFYIVHSPARILATIKEKRKVLTEKKAAAKNLKEEKLKIQQELQKKQPPKAPLKQASQVAATKDVKKSPQSAVPTRSVTTKETKPATASMISQKVVETKIPEKPPVEEQTLVNKQKVSVEKITPPEELSKGLVTKEAKEPKEEKIETKITKEETKPPAPKKTLLSDVQVKKTEAKEGIKKKTDTSTIERTSVVDLKTKDAKKDVQIEEQKTLAKLSTPSEPTLPPPATHKPLQEHIEQKVIQKPLTVTEQLKKKKLSLAFEDASAKVAPVSHQSQKIPDKTQAAPPPKESVEEKSKGPPSPEQPAVKASSFKFLCPYCKQKLEAERDWGGLQINCPICAKKIIIPKPKR